MCNIYIYIYIHIYTRLYVYIYIERERCIGVHTHTVIDTCCDPSRSTMPSMTTVVRCEGSHRNVPNVRCLCCGYLSTKFDSFMHLHLSY